MFKLESNIGEKHPDNGKNGFFRNLFDKTARWLILILCLLFVTLGLFFIIISIYLPLSPLTKDILKLIGNSLLITGLVSIGTTYFIKKQSERVQEYHRKKFEEEISFALNNLHSAVTDLTKIIRESVYDGIEIIRNEVSEQTRKITNYVGSLNDLNITGAVRLYKNRSEAKYDIKQTLTNEAVNEIKIIGISLNDLVRDEDEILHDAWENLEKYIRREGKRIKRLDIKLLIIDPCSNGAYLRASAEAQRDYFAPRLFEDVITSMTHFRELEKLSDQKGGNDSQVSFEAKIYRTPPILYLVWTPNISFVQQYYFWPSHKSNINIPIIKYHKQTGSVHPGRYMHDELKDHFNWIWNHASITLSEFIDMHC